MKKYVTISLFIFWAIVTAVLVAGLVFYQNQKNIGGSLNNTNNQIVESGSGLTLNLAQIAKHNSTIDCWLLINGKVYNVSSYLSGHPGGIGTITPYCGKEATQAFATKDIGRPHSSQATNMLASYLLGNLNQTLIGQQPKTNLSGSTNTASPNPSGVTIKNNPPAQTVIPIVTGQLILNKAEIAKHNSTQDCWLLISDKIYNVTSYLSGHPGGVGTISPYCGQDAAQAFATKDIGRPHSTGANNLLSSYFIGNLDQTIGQQQIQNNIQQTNTVVPPNLGGEREFEGEDD